jgi:hypothetical protein
MIVKELLDILKNSSEDAELWVTLRDSFKDYNLEEVSIDYQKNRTIIRIGEEVRFPKPWRIR